MVLNTLQSQVDLNITFVWEFIKFSDFFQRFLVDHQVHDVTYPGTTFLISQCRSQDSILV